MFVTNTIIFQLITTLFIGIAIIQACAPKKSDGADRDGCCRPVIDKVLHTINDSPNSSSNSTESDSKIAPAVKVSNTPVAPTRINDNEPPQKNFNGVIEPERKNKAEQAFT